MKCAANPGRQLSAQELELTLDAEAVKILVRALNHTDDVDAHDMAYAIESAAKRWLPPE